MVEHTLRPRSRSRWFYVLFLLILSVGGSVRADSDTALALLRGVEQSRTVSDAGRIEFEIEFVMPDRGFLKNGVIEFDGIRRRSEGNGEFIHTVIRDGDELYDFRASPHADVRLFDFEEAATRDLVLFDPRIVGLSDVMAMDTSVPDCLWREGMPLPSIIFDDSPTGENLLHVRLQKDSSTVFDFWIEEPSFRVHKVTHSWPGRFVEILSEFSDADSVFPSRVVANRFAVSKDTAEQEVISTRVYSIGKLILGTPPPPERFTLASMNLPRNTAINDYRIDRIVGYWDGEAVLPQPMSGPYDPSPASPATPRPEGNQLLFVANVLVVAVLLFVYFRRRSRVGSSSRQV